jgi:hypothetical protein
LQKEEIHKKKRRKKEREGGGLFFPIQLELFFFFFFWRGIVVRKKKMKKYYEMKNRPTYEVVLLPTPVQADVSYLVNSRKNQSLKTFYILMCQIQK